MKHRLKLTKADWRRGKNGLKLTKNDWNRLWRFHPEGGAKHTQTFSKNRFFFGCGFFAYNWKLPAYSGAFLLTIDNFSFLLTVGALLLTVLASLQYNWSFFACSGKVRLIRALRDCKQRSLTVSKKAPTVSKKLPPFSSGGVVFSMFLDRGVVSVFWGTRSALVLEWCYYLTYLEILRGNLRAFCRGFARRGGFKKGGFGGCSPVPKTGMGGYYMWMFPVPNTGTRAHSSKPPLS